MADVRLGRAVLGVDLMAFFAVQMIHHGTELWERHSAVGAVIR